MLEAVLEVGQWFLIVFLAVLLNKLIDVLEAKGVLDKEDNDDSN